MRLDDVPESVNVEDRRGIRLRRGGAIGGGVAVIALVLALLGAPKEVVQQVLQGGEQTAQEEQVPIDPAQAPVASQIKRVVTTTERTWGSIFQRNGRQYQPPTLVLFSEAVQSACGMAGSAVGPFYCPEDRKVYLDLDFFQELDRRFGAPGDFARGYVVAHEVGHHIQVLTGISEQLHARRQAASEVEGNRLSVKQELQADCYAGIWAREGMAAGNRLDPGDIEEGLGAAAAIGDDTLQKKARGQVVPESFTHGSSAQRVQWFRRGFDTGKVDACDTFRDDRL
jgi:predicted metalloprotease